MKVIFHIVLRLNPAIKVARKSPECKSRVWASISILTLTLKTIFLNVIALVGQGLFLFGTRARFYMFSLIGLLFLSSCASFEVPVLGDEGQLAVPEDKEKGTAALKFNNGMLENFSGDIYSWWVGNEQLALSKISDTLKIVCKNIGPNYTPFGKQITPVDFSGSEALKLRVRATGATAPVLRIDLKDVNGSVANTAAPQVKIVKNGAYQDYYFSFKDKWKQSYPNTQLVDPTMISELMFFINPGMTGFTGTVYIDDIVAISYTDIPQKESLPGGVVDAFEDEPTSWWSGSGKITLEKVTDKDIVTIKSNGAGPTYETFGRSFESIDFTQSPIVKISAKSIPSDSTSLPNLRIAVKDANGYVANEFAIINTIDTAGFKEYYFDFEGKFSQTYPEAHSVDPKRITEILFFINPGEKGYFGAVQMDYVEVITRKKMTETK